MTKFKQRSIEELETALRDIQKNAYSPMNDDWIWMDDETPLGLYIDKLLQEVE